MRFLVDECTGPAVARWLRDLSHEVFSIYEEARACHSYESMARVILNVSPEQEMGAGWAYHEGHEEHEGWISTTLPIA